MRYLFLLLAISSCAPNLGKNDNDLFLSKRFKGFASPKLHTYRGCKELAFDLKEAALLENHNRIAMNQNNLPISYPVCAAPIPTGAGASMGAVPGSLTEGLDFSGTNNQEKGVDEADIIKTDGRFFYLLKDSSFKILSINEGKFSPAGEISLGYPAAKGFLILGDQAFIFSEAEPKGYIYSSDDKNFVTPSGKIRVDIIDMGVNRNTLKLSDSQYYQGEYLTARKIAGSIQLATSQQNSLRLYYSADVDYDFYRKAEEEKKIIWLKALAELEKNNEERIKNFDFETVLPQRVVKDGNSLALRSPNELDCAQTYSADDSSTIGLVSLITIKPRESSTDVSIKWVRSNEPTVYASLDQLIIASPEHSGWWFHGLDELQDQTTIHRFTFDDDYRTQYADSARVPGLLHNSFSLSEHQGYLRVATTTGKGRSWREQDKEENHLFILGDEGGKFGIISSLKGLALGERIWSARFSNDKGFLVTFRRIDPLFTLDLSDVRNPQVAGELKIPGVSTYLQDIGQDKLLSVGIGGDEEGLNSDTTISLFDVKDFSNPSLASSLSLVEQLPGFDSVWSRSEANDNHLAINYFAPLGLTAIPVNAHYYKQDINYFGAPEYRNKLVLVNTVPGLPLTKKGEINHADLFRRGNHTYDEQTQIHRSYFIGNYIYAISSNWITANHLTDMTMTGVYNLAD